MRTFQSLEAIREAEVEELKKAPSLNEQSAGESMNFFIKSVKKTRNNPLNVPANYGRLMSCRIACAALRRSNFVGGMTAESVVPAI